KSRENFARFRENPGWRLSALYFPYSATRRPSQGMHWPCQRTYPTALTMSAKGREWILSCRVGQLALHHEQISAQPSDKINEAAADASSAAAKNLRRRALSAETAGYAGLECSM